MKGVGDEISEVKSPHCFSEMAKGSHRAIYEQIVTRKSKFAINILLKWHTKKGNYT